MKTDARVRYTKKAVQESFFILLKDNPINKITVKKICELAEINRATFYKYYNDPYDLLKQIELEHIKAMEKLIEDADNKNITETLIIIITAIKENSQWYSILISENGDSNFINKVILDSYNIKKPLMDDLLPTMPENYQSWLYSFMTQGCTSILISWLNEGMKESPLEIAQFINKLNNIILNGLNTN